MAERHVPGARRILHIIDSLGLGGAQAVVKSYFDARSDDPNLHLFALRATPASLSVLHPNVHVHDSSSRYSLGPMRALQRLIEQQRIQLLHCHLFRSQVMGTLLKTLFTRDVRLVFHEHGRVVGREEPAAEVVAFRTFIRLASGSVDAFICNSELARGGLLKLAPNALRRAVVVPNPITQPREPLMETASARRQFAVPASAFVVGFAGRLVEPKGWMEFLHAVKLAGRQAAVFFLLAGEGRDHERVLACIHELQLADRGRMLGYVSDMSAFYRAVDCLVMPSRWEPHGLSQLEAQAHRTPVIVANVPGMSSTVHEGVDALLFQAGNADDLAQQMLRLANDPALRERLASGGRANAARFTFEAFANGVEAAYTIAMQPHSAAAPDSAGKGA